MIDIFESDEETTAYSGPNRDLPRRDVERPRVRHDLVVAEVLLRAGTVERVLILDCDMHYGDGTDAILGRTRANSGDSGDSGATAR
jgi:hypothetical protein